MNALFALFVFAAAPAASGDLFLPVAKVLQSPRCRNCHPDGDAPLQHDDGKKHAQNVTRAIDGVGMTCNTCHAETPYTYTEHLPPGAPSWHLPPASQVFEGKTPAALCRQLKDPATNGGKTLVGLLDHVTHDALVKWGWTPGPGRTTPPLTHAEFVDAFKSWVDAGAPCPE